MNLAFHLSWQTAKYGEQTIPTQQLIDAKIEEAYRFNGTVKLRAIERESGVTRSLTAQHYQGKAFITLGVDDPKETEYLVRSYFNENNGLGQVFIGDDIHSRCEVCFDKREVIELFHMFFESGDLPWNIMN